MFASIVDFQMKKQSMFNPYPTTIFTCLTLAKAGLVVGPLRPFVLNTFGVPSLCNL